MRMKAAGVIEQFAAPGSTFLNQRSVNQSSVNRSSVNQRVIRQGGPMFEVREAHRELDWLLDEMISNAPLVRHALLVVERRPRGATSTGMDRETGEHLAAVASALNSLAKGAGRQFDAGAVRQTMVELEDGFLFVILGLCQGRMLTVAEIAAQAGLPLNVVRVLLADLRDGRHIQVMHPTNRMPDDQILREVLDGPRTL
jgi:predicted regulator of Ras-like GTPase activity (Roadblock/LC7/MglB family)